MSYTVLLPKHHLLTNINRCNGALPAGKDCASRNCLRLSPRVVFGRASAVIQGQYLQPAAAETCSQQADRQIHGADDKMRPYWKDSRRLTECE